MRLLHRGDEPDCALDEADCYAHSYGQHVSDHVDRVQPPAPSIPPEIPWDVDTPPHVTTEALKRQFVERLEARRRSRRRLRGS
jgi:hypothetical protein